MIFLDVVLQTLCKEQTLQQIHFWIYYKREIFDNINQYHLPKIIDYIQRQTFWNLSNLSCKIAVEFRYSRNNKFRHLTLWYPLQRSIYWWKYFKIYISLVLCKNSTQKIKIQLKTQTQKFSTCNFKISFECSKIHNESYKMHLKFQNQE